MPADLTARQVAAIAAPGRHRVARCLYLRIDDDGRRNWVFQYVSPTQRRSRRMGLGTPDVVSTAKAIEMSLRLRLAVLEGRDPVDERRAARPTKQQAMTFEKVAALCIADRAKGWRGPTQERQWNASLKTYAFPMIGKKTLRDVTTGDIAAILKPIWTAKAVTAERLLHRISAVWSYGKAHDMCAGQNPAQWEDHLENLGFKKRKPDETVVPMAAVPWKEMPLLWRDVAASTDGFAVAALQFALLTTMRSGAVYAARWDEIDRARRIWTIPAARMKHLGKDFVVPLSIPALKLLAELAKTRRGDYLFPGRKAGYPIAENGMQNLLRALRPGCTVHGTTRSGFKDWSAAEAGIEDSISEIVLGHKVKGRTRRAYLRDDLIDVRRPIMQRWALFLIGKNARKEIAATAAAAE